MAHKAPLQLPTPEQMAALVCGDMYIPFSGMRPVQNKGGVRVVVSSWLEREAEFIPPEHLARAIRYIINYLEAAIIKMKAHVYDLEHKSAHNTQGGV